MALFKNSYSGLITKGLGMPACCGMITMGFTLFKCTITITPEPPTGGGGSGGGSYANHPNIYTPLDKYTRKPKRTVTITVKMGKKSTWRAVYVIGMQKANIAVKVINVVNAAFEKMRVLANVPRRMARSVIARFDK